MSYRASVPARVPLPYRDVRSIPRRDAPSVAEFRARWQHAPVVLRGVAEGWPARRWSPDRLAAAHGAAEVPAYVLRGGRIQLDRGQGFLVERMSLARYVAEVAAAEADPGSGARFYLRASLDSLPRALAAEVEVPTYARGRPALRQNVWFGARDTVSHLHFDLPRNLVTQLYGEKRFILFSPLERGRLYPHRWFSSTPHLSELDAEHPDLGRHPRAQDAVAHEATLSPGDTLFIPPGWWHYARALSTSISVNTWWSPWVLRPLVALSDAYKRARGLNI